ncbi:hypothetical protein CcCBS67573_g09690 [Chytriomyces confervae]|uniref:protein S-acyltransferase n=1 Tax=Chytriomyces confervae TaxID=246404 RepID=A0A507DRI0_9FUNG|nr:hypothetical protein HDU80_000286 [Chytriomyces hyalinus]TPX53558.1 hypothetical protein CcCBS67573_g09690 [Chytriomyces confervae]
MDRNLLHLPAEVLHDILVRLPITGPTVRSVGMTCRHLHGLVLGNMKFPRQHLAHQLQALTQSASIRSSESTSNLPEAPLSAEPTQQTQHQAEGEPTQQPKQPSPPPDPIWQYLETCHLITKQWQQLPINYLSVLFARMIAADYSDEQLQDDPLTPYVCDAQLRRIMDPMRWLLPEPRALALVESLLEHAHMLNLNMDTHGGCLLRWYCIYGQATVVNRLLLVKGVDPMERKGCAIGHAAELGHMDVLQLLLKDGRVDPDVDEGYTLRMGVEGGNVQVVRMLLEYGVDPSLKESIAFCLACARGHTEIVRLLLADARTNAAAVENYGIAISCEKGFLPIVEMLMARPEVDLTVENGYPIRVASSYGFNRIVAKLLGDARVVEHYRENWDFMRQHNVGHMSVTRVWRKMNL